MRPPADDRSRPTARRGVALRAAAASVTVAVGLLAFAPVTFADALFPKSGGSPNANSIHTLYTVVLIIATIVFIGVEGALGYAVWRFRAKKHKVAYQIHGNTRLEIGWTAGAAFILLILAVVTFIKLPSIVDAPNSSANGYEAASLTQPTTPNGKILTVCVQGRQYIWRYTYGPNCRSDAYSDRDPYSYTTMVVPEHTTVKLVIQSLDVIHSWWVPSLGGKVDAVPGDTTYTWFKALHTGFFHGQCAQLCGWNHAAMVAYVRVVTPSQYGQWLQGQQKLIADQDQQIPQLRSILRSENQLGS